MANLKAKELAKMVKDKTIGLSGTKRFIKEAFESGQLKPNDFSIRDMAKHLVPDGDEWLTMLAGHDGGLMEASSAVDTGAMNGITGQLIFSTIKSAYDEASLIGDRLVTTFPSAFQDEEFIPGVGNSTSSDTEIEEGQPYPSVGLGKDKTFLPRAKKHGDILGLTREVLIADRTFVLTTRAANLGRGHAHNREEEIVNTVTGNGALYKYTRDPNEEPAGINPYQAATPFINTVAKTLTDYTDIDEAERLLLDQVDPITGRPIVFNPNTILVPPALRATAMRIVNSMMVNTTAGANETRAQTFFRGSYDVVESIYVKRATNSDSQWFFGNPSAAFVWKEIWPLTVVPAPDSHPDNFNRDIVMQWKASYKGVAGVMDPRHVAKFT